MILQFIVKYSEITLDNVNSVSIQTAYIVLSTFEHCKNSPEVYKNTFNIELLDIFRDSQEVHLLLLRLLDSCITMKHVKSNNLDIPSEVLDLICEISSALSDLNAKSMINNWKAYIGILQKFHDDLEDTIDLKKPLKYLLTEIIKNFSSLINLDSADPTPTSIVNRTISIIKFLISVALKMFYTFWNLLEKLSEEILIFCYSCYSFSLDYFQLHNFPDNVVKSIKPIFVSIEPFVYRLSNNPVFSKKIHNLNNQQDHLSSGMVHFLNVFLSGILECDSVVSDFRLDTVLRVIFSNLRACFLEFFCSSNLFDNLVLNISGAVIKCNHSYSEVEIVLLENIMQYDIFPGLLSLEIWSLLLSNSTTQLCIDTLKLLMDKYDELNFGINNYQLEKIFLKDIIQRIFRILSYTVEMEVIEILEINTDIQKLKAITLDGLPHYQKHLIANLCANTVGKIDLIVSDTFSFQDLVYIGENFEILSTADFQDLGLNASNLVNAVSSLWKPTHTDFNNNILKYFIMNLCKITRALILEFNTKQLFTILNQLKVLSSYDSYQLQVCYILAALSDKNMDDFGKDKIFSLLQNIFCPNLINSSNKIIRQNALEIIDSFFKKNKYDVVNDIMRASTEIQGELSNYLHKNVVTSKFDKEYFNMLDNLKYVHKCVEQRKETHVKKKMRISYSRKTDERSIMDVQILNPSNLDNKIDEEAGNLSEAIATLKSDVKYLLNLLKTESLSRNNVTDLKVITYQLQSLM